MDGPLADAPVRVLLVDDDEVIAGSLCRYLQTQGCAVDVAPDAVSAVPLMRSRRYDVVVVDPYFTGGLVGGTSTLIKDVRELQPGAPLIVLTAYSSPALLQIAASSSLPLLHKPQSVVSLSHIILTAASAASSGPRPPGPRQ